MARRLRALLTPATFITEDGLSTYVERRGPWPCEGSVPQCRGMPGQRGEREWLGGWGNTLIVLGRMGSHIGGFQKGNQERRSHL